MELSVFLKRMVDERASDIFVVAGLPLTYAVGGRQIRLEETGPMTPQNTEQFVR